MSLEFQLLKASQEQGKWGFSQQFIGPTQQSLITVDLPSYMARVWTLQMLRWRYANGTLAGAPASTNPDAQTVAGTGPKVVLQYGVDSAQERVRMDYSKSGFSCQFHASVIRVYLEAPGTAVASGLGTSGILQPPNLSPIVAGFVTPYGKGAASADLLPSVTFTTNQLQASFGLGAVVVNVPDRARAYRLVIAQDGTDQQVRVRQFAGDGVTPLAFDYASSDVLGEFPVVQAAPEQHIAPTRQTFMPLVREAEMLFVESTTAGGNTIFTVQFLLDIG